MARTKEGLTKALEAIPKLREEFWKNLKVPGEGLELNQQLEKAGRVADFMEFSELMVRDALTREESCGGHFRSEHQTEEGEAKRNDENFAYVAGWEHTGDPSHPRLHKENLEFEEAARLREAAAAEALRKRLADTETALTQEETDRLTNAAAAEALRARLQDADTELTAMTLRLEEERRRAEETLTLLAAAETEANQSLDEQTAQERETNRQKRLLALAQERLSEEEAVSAEAKRQQQLLNAQVRELRGELSRLQGLLDLAKAEDASAQVRIETLGADLNQALARVAAEQTKRAELEEAERKRLERYQSEFFGQLRDLLGDREGVRIVGDRFVFSSEVLFDSGSADLSDEGRAQIARVAQILSDVAGDIPDNIDWVVRVDGHTDNRPIVNASTYANNWELSQARALSVVLFMVEDLGFPTRRLAATGFGEFQPVAAGDSADARAQNRRIELKLTER